MNSNGAFSLNLDPEMLRYLMQQHAAGQTSFSMPGMPNMAFRYQGDCAPSSASNSSTAAGCSSSALPQNTGFAAFRSTSGRSRAYRKNGVEIVQGQLAGVPSSAIQTPNPVVPLKFEQPAGTWTGEPCFTAVWVGWVEGGGGRHATGCMVCR